MGSSPISGPASLPIDVERALDVLIEAGYRRVGVDALLLSACDWLGVVAQDNGSISLAFPEIENYARAEHWADWTYVPGLNPTAGLAGRLHLDGRHPPVADPGDPVDLGPARVRVRRGRACPGRGADVPRLRARPETRRAGCRSGWSLPCGPPVVPRLPRRRGLRAHSAPPGADPNSPWRRLFDDATIDGHLNRMVRDQEPDGGWGITWKAPGCAFTLEWRGIETLRALRTLTAYGRL